MTETLTFRVDGAEHEIALDGAHAPGTLAGIIAALPATVDVHCAKIAGSHIMWPVPVLERLETAADVLAMPPGAFFYWPERQYLEITYDALQAETASVSYLGRLVGDVAWLRDYADRQRREQGRRIFTADVFVRGDSSARADPESESGGPDVWRRLCRARRDAWRAQPADVQALLDRRGLNLPFGSLAMAEGELRKLHELLWRLWNEGERRADGEKVVIAVFALEAAVSRVGGFCHMQATAGILRDGIECFRHAAAPTQDILAELVLFAGRVAAWLDLHICWWPMNELTLEALHRR
jgi:hypothetical protein